MKKTILYLFAMMSFPLLGIAADADKAPHVNANSIQLMSSPVNPPNNTNALFDLQFDYVLSRGGFAGITWTYSNFWVSKWGSDSIFTVDDSTGAITSTFFVSGVTGVRAMSFDGTGVWIANNTTTLYKVDTSSHAILKTVTAPFNARGVTFDNTTNGLWVSDFGSDITLIDTTGNVQASLVAATHTLTGVYGIAYDSYSSGGPYIWAFDQAGGGQYLVRIPVGTGIPDLRHNINLEVGGTGSGIAGGVAITGFANPGPHSIIGVSQNSPHDRIFGYELADYIPPAYDASADSIYFYPANTKTPDFLVEPIHWEVVTTNNGGNTIDTLGADITVNDGTSNVFTANGYINGAPVLARSIVSINNAFTPAATAGTNYSVQALINTHTQTDLIPDNDTIGYNFSITDSVLSRHGAATGRIGLTNGSEGVVSIMYDLPVFCYAMSVTLTLAKPPLGDSVYAEIWDFNGAPINQVARSSAHIITAADTGGVVLTLPLWYAPVGLTPGSYLVGIHQFNNNVSIAYSTFNWRPSTCWIGFTASASWGVSEDNNFFIVPFIDLNLWSALHVGVADNSMEGLSIYPNPAYDNFKIMVPTLDKYNLSVTDIQGKLIYQNYIAGKEYEVIETSKWPNGIYISRMESDGKNYISKLVVNH